MNKQLSNLLIIAGLSGTVLSGLKSYNTSKEMSESSPTICPKYDPVIIYSTISSLSLISACAGIAFKPRN
jgi:hypothetical protein